MGGPVSRDNYQPLIETWLRVNLRSAKGGRDPYLRVGELMVEVDEADVSQYQISKRQ